ncbi:MAG: glycosyltransferase family 4 protein [Muribaculaceae bacterium]|nr:glycosyltransferase family 4 protein [Muribaculaceae bacterium]
MNIIHIISNKVWGGGERYALDLCTALRSQGNNVAIVCRNKAEVLGPVKDAGFEPAVMRLGGAFDIFSPIHIARMARRFPGDGPVNIHVHNFKDAATAVKVRQLCQGHRRINIVCTRHLVKAGKPKQLALYRAIDSLVFVSERARAEFIKGGFDIHGLNLDVVHNALPDVPELQSAQPLQQPPLILYIGRLSPEKGAHILVQALGKLTDLEWRARICGQGEGKYVMPMLRLCRTLGIDKRVEWPGHISDVSEEIAAAQIGVVPTTAAEAFGLSIIEMMRQGLPVVTTDNGAQPEIITHGTDGLMVPPADADALAEALRRLISPPGLRPNIGMDARRPLEANFTSNAFNNKITEKYL